MGIIETGRESMEWIQLAQNMIQWGASVNVVISIRVP